MCHQDGRSVNLTHMQLCQCYYPGPRKCAGSVASDTTAMEGGGRSLPMTNNSAVMYSERTVGTELLSAGPNSRYLVQSFTEHKVLRGVQSQF